MNIRSKNEFGLEKIEYLDDTAANQKEYWGWAELGSATGSAVWRIMRRTYSDATLTTYVDEWANYGGYDAEWDNLATETYR